MKDLYKYISESLFDDDDIIFDKVSNHIYDKIFKNTSFVVGTDKKTIVFSPDNRYGGLSTIDRRLDFSSVDRHYELYKNINNINKLGLKFQPLSSICIDLYGTQNIDVSYILKNLPCMGVSEVSVELGDKKQEVDFSTVNFDITYSIVVSSYGCKTPPTIKPYKKHLSVVNFSSINNHNIYNPENVYGWDCDVLIINSEYFRTDKAYGHGEGLMYGYEIDKIQTLIDANPKAKMILLWDGHLQKYWKVNTKSSKRIFDKIVNKRFEWHRDSYHDIESLVMGWEYKNQNLFPKNIKEGILDEPNHHTLKSMVFEGILDDDEDFLDKMDEDIEGVTAAIEFMKKNKIKTDILSSAINVLIQPRYKQMFDKKDENGCLVFFFTKMINAKQLRPEVWGDFLQLLHHILYNFDSWERIETKNRIAFGPEYHKNMTKSDKDNLLGYGFGDFDNAIEWNAWAPYWMPYNKFMLKTTKDMNKMETHFTSELLKNIVK